MNALRPTARVPFNLQLHQDSLKQLWHLVLGTVPFPEGAQSSHWKSVGFQTANPCTDFRGAGLLSLNQLIYFVEQWPETFASIRPSLGSFQFAVAGLNLTYCLIFLFQLSSPLAVPVPGTHRAHPAEMKAFSRLNCGDADALNQVFAAGMSIMFDYWQSTSHDVEELPMCVQKAVRRIQWTLRQQPADLAEFQVWALN